MRYVGPKGEPFVDLGYSYDRANNRLSETRFHEGREDHFSYDSVYRLAGAQYGLAAPRTGKGDKDDDHEKKSPLGVSAETFVFDGVGNRTSLAQTLAGSGGEKEKHEDHDKGKHDAVPTVTTSYATNSVNEYTSVGGLLQGHDPSGNLLDDGRFTYRYDFRNLLVELRSKKTGTVAHYRYDALGRRIEKTFTMGGAPGDDDEREDRDDDDRASAGTRRYVYDGARILEERTDDHFAGKEWVYGVGLDEPVRMVHRRAGRADRALYYMQNAIGSVVALADKKGHVVERYEYQAFGKEVVLNGEGERRHGSAFGNPYRFQGRWRDFEEGSPLVYRELLDRPHGRGPYRHIRDAGA